MKKSKRLAALTLTLAMALPLAACGGGSSSDDGKGQTGGETGGNETAYLTEFVDWQTQANENTTFLINYSEERSNSKVLCNCISPLIEYNNHGVLGPALAESWEMSEDAMTWTFHIRKGIYWVDQKGNQKDECTAYDWLTSLEWNLNYHKNAGKNTSMPFATIAGAQEYYDYTKELDETAGKATKYTDEKFLSTVGIEAPDAYTLIYHMSKPCPYFGTIACGACLYPLAQGQVDELGVDGTFAQQPDTMWYNGPYIITEYVNNNSKVMTKNEAYWDKDCQLFDTVTILMVQDAVTDDTMFLNGEIDRCTLSEANLRMIADDPNNEWNDYLVQPRGVFSHRQIFFNYARKNTDGTWDTNWNTAAANENFRQSLYYGMDLTNLLSYYSYVNPESIAVNTFTVPGVAVFSDGTDYCTRVEELLGNPGIRYDAAKGADYAAKAKEELSAAGVTFPIQMHYYIKSGDQAALDLATIVKSTVESVSDNYIELVIDTYVNNYTQEVTNNSLNGIQISGWAADYGDPENFIDQLIRGNDAAFFANRAMKVNDMAPSEARDLLDEYTAMVNAADAIVDNVDDRYQAQAEAEAFYYQHALAIPLAKSDTWQLTRANAMTTPYGAYGVQMDVYKNWNATTEKAYSAADYEQFQADYNAGKI